MHRYAGVSSPATQYRVWTGMNAVASGSFLVSSNDRECHYAIDPLLVHRYHRASQIHFFAREVHDVKAHKNRFANTGRNDRTRDALGYSLLFAGAAAANQS